MAGEIEYAKSGGKNVAYQVFGDGPLDIVIAHPLMGTMRLFRRGAREHFDRLTKFARVIMFDRRGTGVSDPTPLDDLPSIEEWSEDIIAVMDAAGSRTAALAGFIDGGRLAICVAAMHPERVSALILFHTMLSTTASPDYPWVATDEQRLKTLKLIESGWEDPSEHVARFGTASAGGTDPEGYRRFMQQVGSPEKVAAFVRHVAVYDVRGYLPSIEAPTLVLHRGDNKVQPIAIGRYAADHVPHARFVELAGNATNPLLDMGPVIDEIEEFLTGSRPAPEPERSLAAVLFTDIVASTDSKVKTGDKRWRELLTEHHRIVRKQIERHGGREVNTSGDGFLAMFDSPLRAIRSAQAIVENLRQTGLHIRAGVHAGEVERMDDDITGLTVDIGARVSALAGPDEVLVSSTVHDMAIGSGITFEERGEHTLKGVPGRWRLYAVTD